MVIGSTISHYKIVQKLGEGGMGVVYKAEDTTLERTVALKFLPAHLVANEDVRKRFIREAKTAAALQHPNICTVFEIGEAGGHVFIAMAYIEGLELADEIAQGPLDVERTLDLSIQFADGLAAAHSKGTVHRDIKPPNLFVASDGRALILDFGLAQLASTNSKLTREGTTLGTCAYMSPEQASGDVVDARSDVWAMGCVLYEMLVGQAPFRGHYEQATIYSILNDPPEPITAHRQDVPEELERLITRCLSKQAPSRPSSAKELAEGLRAIKRNLESESHRRPVEKQEPLPSVAVLPFENQGRDEDDEYLSDGIADEIINALTNLDGVHVAARSSAFHFKGKSAPLEEIAEKLHVGAIVEGTVRRAGKRLRVTAQLVDVSNGYQVWSERYDRVMADIFDVQDEISRAIVEQLKVKLIGEQPLVTKPTSNNDAYELYLKGRHYWHQRSPSALAAAIQCFEETIKLDPDYALAYAGLVDCYGLLRAYGWVSAADGQPPAHAAMTKAMTLAPSLWQVSFSRGFYYFYFERDWSKAGPHFLSAISVNPRSSISQAYYGLYLATEGRAEDAIAQTALACDLDPLSPLAHSLHACALLVLGRFEDSANATEPALELMPDYILGLWFRGVALSGLRRDEEAIGELERLVTLSRSPVYVACLGLAYARAGRHDDVTRLIQELEDRGGRGEYVPALAMLAIHAGQGDLAAMRRTLASAMAEATPAFALSATCGPFIQSFRSDPEINQLLSDLYGW